jgi:predicted tellurium resistance membrane protein TerC
MIPRNEAAVIVMACQDLDKLMQRKYLFIGGMATAVIFLEILACIVLFFNVQWFLTLFTFPFLIWYGAECYLDRVSTKIAKLLEIIQYHHHNEMLRHCEKSVHLHNEI